MTVKCQLLIWIVVSCWAWFSCDSTVLADSLIISIEVSVIWHVITLDFDQFLSAYSQLFLISYSSMMLADSLIISIEVSVIWCVIIQDFEHIYFDTFWWSHYHRNSWKSALSLTIEENLSRKTWRCKSIKSSLSDRMRKLKKLIVRTCYEN